MVEDVFKPLLMGYVDNELTPSEVTQIKEHLEHCQDCRNDLEGFRRLKEATQDMRLIMPDDKYWEDYWSHIYNRLERNIGWIFISLGTILLLSYGFYKLIEGLLFQSTIPLVIRIGVVALVAGLCTLMVSVLRERIFLSKSDKYERIKR